MKPYKHTQIGYVLIAAFSVAIALIVNLIFTTNFDPGLILVLGFMIVCLALFATLTVEVDDQAVKLHFGIGVIRKRFLLKEIEAQRAVKNPWYYGWGIHLIPNGWIFNVSGTKGIELLMKNGRKYRIGTNDIAGLIHAIEVQVQKA